MAIRVDLLLAKEKANDKPDGLRRSPPWSRQAARSEPPLEQKNVRRPKGYAPLPAGCAVSSALSFQSNRALLHRPQGV